MYHDALKRTARRTPLWTIGGALLAFVMLTGRHLPAEVFVELEAVDVSAVAADTSDDADFAGGASLKTDPELEQLLKKADEFAGDERYDLASVLWQRVLDETSGTVMTRNDWESKTSRQKYRRYRSVTGEIEQTIAKLPPAGLRIYRLSADGEAQALLAGAVGDRREEALAQLTRRYFLSTHGDDAAYELACMRLDRYEFVGASRLLAKILQEYPDPSVSRADVLFRLAVTAARVGDREAAEKSLADLKQTGGYGAKEFVALVERDLAREGIDAPRPAGASEQWTIAYGNAARTGHMQGLPNSITSSTMSELWSESFDVALTTAGSDEYPYRVYEEIDLLKRKSIGRPQPSTNVSTSPQALVNRWKENGWSPAGEVLLYGGLLYYKSNNRLVARNVHTGELVWMGRANRFRMDQLSQIFAQRGQQFGRPSNAAEVMLFGDRIHQGMTISDGWLFNIEGDLVDDFGAVAVQEVNAEQRRVIQYGGGGSAQRARRNWIAAYDAANGKLKWHRSAASDEAGGKFDVGFLAAPVPFARFLLAPVSDAGSLWIYALEKNTGALAWKTFLCDDPVSGANPWSPVAVAVDGGDAYISTGAGVVFTIDALSGGVRWASRYRRSGVSGNVQNYRYGNGYQLAGQIDGWREDMVIPHGKHLVVMASDCDEIFALDRRSGDFLWESPRTPEAGKPSGEYCLGVVDDSLYVGGKSMVRRYHLGGGKLMWEAKLSSSMGRGALTDDAIYIPENETIVKLDLAGGKRLAQVGVFSAAEEPVGNLFTDGKRLLALGLGRIYALTDLSYRLDLLADRIQDGDVKSQLERMRLRLRENNHAGALDDLRGAYEKLLAKRQTADAVATMCAGLEELAVASRSPQTALELLAEMPAQIESSVAQPQAFSDLILAKRAEVLSAALQRIADQEIAGTAAQVLSVVPLCNESHLLEAAGDAMRVTAAPADAQRLRDALKSPRVGVRTVAMAGLPVALGDSAQDVLAELLKDDSDHIKIEAAWVLGNTGHRQSLTAFADLLESEDLNVRVRAAHALRGLTGQKIKFSAYDTEASRAEGVKAWRDWIATDGQTAKLEFPIRSGAAILGRTLICYYSQNKVIELDAEGKELWTANVPYAWGCQGLPNGNRVVASYSGRFIVEYNAEGKEIWKKTGLPGSPFSVERLENGNTLVTCSDSQKVVEIAPDQSIAWEVEISGRPMDAQRLENGNTLIALQTIGKVVEVDRSGKVVWEIDNQGGVLAASRLENGNTLICRQANNMVAEVNRRGEVIWSKGDLRNPYDAQRLPSGNTLIVDYTGVKEVNPKGEMVWERAGNGASRVHRY